MDELLLKVGKALVAEEVVFRREGTEISALALVAEELSVVGREVDKTVEVVLAVELEQGLKGGQAVEVERLDRLDAVRLGRLALEDHLVLFVTGAKCDNGKLRRR